MVRRIGSDCRGVVVVKVFWLTSIVLSLILTLLLNLAFNH